MLDVIGLYLVQIVFFGTLVTLFGTLVTPFGGQFEG